jgi:seryl-tRNA synthetase
MLNIDFIKQNKELVQSAAINKNRKIDTDLIIELDDKRRELILKVQKLREERNLAGKTKPSAEVIARGKVLKEELQQLETELSATEANLQTEMYKVPNIPLEEVPVGKTEDNNVVIKTWGDIKEKSFTEEDHVKLFKRLGYMDTVRGNKVSGFRGYFLTGKGAELAMTLLHEVFFKLIKKGYTPIIAPSRVKEFGFYGNGQFPWGREEVYKLGEDEYLAGTAEVPVMAMHSNETFLEADLPKKYIAFSPCFRKEAGSYGKDTKGIYRVHEFYKIEQVIFAKADIDEARKLHEELQQNVEEILESYNMPYRVLLMCTGDMGEPQIKKYDTEAWIPSMGKYGEVMSNSIMGDFQCRRLNIKYKKPDGTTEFCYSLNNTAIALPRFLVPYVENNL